MLLTCPTCNSGLEVPDGTTALVRCPACKTVFSPADGLAPPETEPEEQDEKPKKSGKNRRARDEDEKPRRKKTARRDREVDAEEEETENRDFDPGDPEEDKKRKRRRREEDSTLSSEERDALKRAFNRAALGCKFIWISFVLYVLSMVLIIAFYFQTAFPKIDLDPGYIIGAGVLGLTGWILGAVGIGFCLSGPPSPGHWGYGISAAVAAGLHLILLGALVSKGTDYSPGQLADPNGPAERWGLIPTRLDAVTFYLTFLVYKDQELIPKAVLGFSIVVGIVEILRTTLLLMLVSCLARAAGDDELHGKCTRAAGFASFGPGFMALGMLAFTVVLTESRAGVTNMTRILFTTVLMGTYAVLNGCVFPGLMAARDTEDACAEPFQSQLPQL